MTKNIKLRDGSSWLNLTPIYGTGFPEGVVSASVGSIYIDKAITNGASSWIKKSGTGSTGWQVLEGDTGWRDVAHSGLSSGSIRLRRLNNNVYVFIGGGFWGIFALTESPAAYAVPTGFKIGLWTSLARMVRDSGKTDAGHIQIDKGNGSVILFYPTVPAGTSVLLTSALTYVTSDPWPTTLPGTPA